MTHPISHQTSAGSAVERGVTPRAVDELRAQLPEGALLTDRSVIESYRSDEAQDPGVGWPAAVVRAASSADVRATMGWASRHQVPVVPRGAGSGLSGGANAVEGGIVLSLERMRDIRIDASTRVAVVQPGLLNVEVKQAAAERGLWYPPDPSSFEICSIGGNAATNAGGLCCLKYGVTADYVLGMRVVLADGAEVSLGGARRKDAAGLNLTRLFVGSGGILGVITELTLRLVPMPPPASTLVAAFPSLESAVDAVMAITGRAQASMLELMDSASINAVEDLTAMGLDRTAQALLFARSDAPGPAAATEIRMMETICRDASATDVFVTDDEQEGEAFAAARRAALPALQKRGHVLIEDVAVSVPALPALVRSVQQIASDHGTTIAVVAHAGEGNVHPLIVYDPSDAAATERARVAFEEVMVAALDLGGTITAEHGVGRLKREWLPTQIGAEAMDLSRRIKAAIDPAGILNPGAVFSQGAAPMGLASSQQT